MKDAFSKVFEENRDGGTDRILATSFFRTRPLQLGASPAVVVSLDDRKKTFLHAVAWGLNGEISAMSVPKSYRTIEEFQREEIRRDFKCGFSLDDLMQDTSFEGSDLLFDDTVDEYDPDQQDDDDD